MSDFSFTHKRQDSGLSKIEDLSIVGINDIKPVFDYDENDIRHELIELEEYYRAQHNLLRKKYEDFCQPLVLNGYQEKVAKDPTGKIVWDDYDFFRKELHKTINYRQIKIVYVITPEVSSEKYTLFKTQFIIEDCTDEYRVDLMSMGRHQIFMDDRLPYKQGLVNDIISNYLKRFE